MAEQSDESEERDKAEESDDSERDKAEEAQEKHEQAQAKMKELEESDEPPTDLEEWPSDEAKYVTYGGAEGDHSYDEGPEKKLGPSSLERKPGGDIEVEGEEVDDPEEHKADPLPGGPTDPDSKEMAGERKKREKMERMYGEDDPSVQAAKEHAKERGAGDEDGSSGDDDSSDDED